MDGANLCSVERLIVEPGIVLQACNPSTQETEASLGYLLKADLNIKFVFKKRLYFKTKKLLISQVWCLKPIISALADPKF